jgi:2-methylcitrate dehydratase PrpD
MHVITGLGVGGAEAQLGQLLLAGGRFAEGACVVGLTSGGAWAARLRIAGVPVVELGMGLNQRFEVCGTSIKRHACCGQTHSAVDSLLDLIKEHGIDWKQIDRIAVELAHKALPIIDNNPLWTHNIQYVMALAAHEGYVGVQHFSPQWTENRDIANLATKVTVKGNDRLQLRFPVKKASIVAISAAGRTFTRELDSPIGNPEAPLAAADLRAKFMGLAQEVLSEPDAESLWNMLSTVDKAPSIEGVLALAGKSPRT